MKKIKNHNINIFLKQLPILKDNNIINEEISNKISNYYQNILESNKNNKKNRNKKVLITILSIISALFISGGIILLIGYNWSLLSKNIKTSLSILLLLTPQCMTLYLLFLHKKKPYLWIKEGLSLFWAIIFGAVVALIGQIYKLPSNFKHIKDKLLFS